MGGEPACIVRDIRSIPVSLSSLNGQLTSNELPGPAEDACSGANSTEEICSPALEFLARLRAQENASNLGECVKAPEKSTCLHLG